MSKLKIAEIAKSSRDNLDLVILELQDAALIAHKCHDEELREVIERAIYGISQASGYCHIAERLAGK
jgi:hypothetical protein